MGEAVLTPRTVTSHQRIPLLFISGGNLPKGEHQGHHLGKILVEKQFGGPIPPMRMLQGTCLDKSSTIPQKVPLVVLWDDQHHPLPS